MGFVQVLNPLCLCYVSFQSFIDTIMASPQYSINNTFCQANLVSYAKTVKRKYELYFRAVSEVNNRKHHRI